MKKFFTSAFAIFSIIVGMSLLGYLPLGSSWKPSLFFSDAGFNDIVINARGTNGEESVALYINDAPVQFWNLTTSFQNYTYAPVGEITVDTLSIHFLNDRWEPQNSINYDVQVDHITVNGTRYDSEHASTVSTGSWDQEDWCAPGNKSTEWLNCSGSFTYNIPAGTVVGIPVSGPVCGNGTTESGEQCDDGNVAGGDGCSATCQTESVPTPICGNNVTESGEQCDDGNTTSGDGCSASCQTESSNNTTPTFSGPIGNQDAPQGESINFPLTSFFSDPDGDTLTYSVAPSSDALPSGLTLSASSGDVTGTASPAGTYSMTFRATDPGNLSADSDTFTFTITGSGGGPVCGNNTLESGEQCDDGNTAGGDGCSAICQTESGTTPVCGNNITEIGEQCDDGNTTSNDGCSASCQTENTPPPTGIIFETNFANDTGYSVSNTNLWNGNGATPPSGWDGVKATGTGSLFSVQPGTGVSGGNALRVKYAPGSSQPTMSLGKHLTGNRNTGYDEIYIRYNVKLPDNFRVANNGNSINHWKWGRLYQNTSTNNTDPGKWTENRSDSGFILWVFNGTAPRTDMNVSWAENSGANLDKGSAGGPLQKADYYFSGANENTAGGYFERLFPFQGPSESNPGRLSNNPQTWHTLEFRYKLATTSSSDDGEMEMWWDGENQGDPTRITAGGGAPSRNGIPTTNRGSGMNFFLLFDNLSGWNSQWGNSDVDGSVYVNDVVVSTDRIGHSYTAGNTDNVN